ncbi:MAG: HigA family addiction module antidote protein [Treponema sp.]|jgi:addiction module HigA family antidote|nr:HigA family addiction module antidote protein [Treponema sp.]
MKKNNQTPGTALKALLEKHGLNCNRLAKAINMSNAMVRLLVLDKSPVSLAAAFRFAKFFKTKPEYWLNLQTQYDLAQAAKDKSLARELSGITDVSKYSFVRKPHTAQKGRKKTGKKKTTLAGKRRTARKVPGAKPARRARSR